MCHSRNLYLSIIYIYTYIHIYIYVISYYIYIIFIQILRTIRCLPGCDPQRDPWSWSWWLWLRCGRFKLDAGLVTGQQEMEDGADREILRNLEDLEEENHMEKRYEKIVNEIFIQILSIVSTLSMLLWSLGIRLKLPLSEVNEEEGLVLQARRQPVLREVPLPWKGRLTGLFCNWWFRQFPTVSDDFVSCTCPKNAVKISRSTWTPGPQIIARGPECRYQLSLQLSLQVFANV